MNKKTLTVATLALALCGCTLDAALFAPSQEPLLLTQAKASGIVAGSVQTERTELGYQVQHSLGAPTSGIAQTSAEGYFINSSIQGALIYER